jgi:hypothetical protein
VGTTIVGRVGGHPQGMVCASSWIICGCTQWGLHCSLRVGVCWLLLAGRRWGGLWSPKTLVESLQYVSCEEPGT